MTTTNKHRFVWHDLNTNDLEGAKRFYGEIFNWKLEGTDYLHISAGGQMIGGMRAMDASEKQPPSWLGYIGVDDVAACVSNITSSGGRVYMPAKVMPNVGTFAVTADPTGAAFAPWKSARAGEDVEPTGAPAPFTFCWDELVTTDPAAAVPFYEKIFGWQGKAMEMAPGEIYTLLQRPGTKNAKGDINAAGGVMKSPAGVPHSFWIPYVHVDNTDKRCEQATRLGAKVMVPAMDIPNVGRFACWSDPQGASIAVLQPMM